MKNFFTSRSVLIAIVLIAVLIKVWAYSDYFKKNSEQNNSNPAEEVTSPIKLSLNEVKKVHDITISVSKVIQDSRCPSDVQCIQAGKIVAKLDTLSDTVSSSTEIEIGKPIIIGKFQFTLTDVKPYPVSTHKTTDGEYRFTIDFVPKI